MELHRNCGGPGPMGTRYGKPIMVLLAGVDRTGAFRRVSYLLFPEPHRADLPHLAVHQAMVLEAGLSRLTGLTTE